MNDTGASAEGPCFHARSIDSPCSGERRGYNRLSFGTETHAGDDFVCCKWSACIPELLAMQTATPKLRTVEKSHLPACGIFNLLFRARCWCLCVSRIILILYTWFLLRNDESFCLKCGRHLPRHGVYGKSIAQWKRLHLCLKFYSCMFLLLQRLAAVAQFWTKRCWSSLELSLERLKERPRHLERGQTVLTCVWFGGCRGACGTHVLRPCRIVFSILWQV